MAHVNTKICEATSVFPQQQNAKGSLHNIDFGVFWASWGGSGKELGSGNRFRVTGFAVRQFREPTTRFDGSDRFCCSKVPGSVFGKPRSGPEALPRFWVQKVACPRFRRFRCSMSSDGLGSVPKVWTEPALGTGFRESEVLRKFRVWRFRCQGSESCFVLTLKVCFCTLKVCFFTLKVKFVL